MLLLMRLNLEMRRDGVRALTALEFSKAMSFIKMMLFLLDSFKLFLTGFAFRFVASPRNVVDRILKKNGICEMRLMMVRFYDIGRFNHKMAKTAHHDHVALR